MSGCVRPGALLVAALVAGGCEGKDPEPASWKEVAPDPAPAEPACVDWRPLDPRSLRELVRELSGEVRLPGAPAGADRLGVRSSDEARGLTRAHLRRRFEAAGLLVIEERYTAESSLVADVMFSGTNVIAVRAAGMPSAAEPPVLLVGGHYDTRPGTPGADDNGSGVAISLALAEALRGCPTRHELRFVAFDQEEIGLVGSRGHARSLLETGAAARISAAFVLDMLGYDPDDDGLFKLSQPCERNNTTLILERMRAQLERVAPRLAMHTICDEMRGDHASLWDARIPALGLSEAQGIGREENPCYHQACDLADGLNFGHLSRLARLVAATVLDLDGRLSGGNPGTDPEPPQPP